MIWETPKFTELKMDAEIGSYQDDFDPSRDVPAFVNAEERDADAPKA
jgi:hypothetical protein